MPNWCTTDYVIDGPKEEIIDLHKKLTDWSKKESLENGFGKAWLGNIVHYAGLKRSDEDKENGVNCRGEFMGEFVLEENDDTIHFGTFTAWGPMPLMWKKILEKHAPHCKYYWSAREPGTEFYASNDVEHKYFNEEIIIETFYHEDADMPDYIKEYFYEDMDDYSVDDMIKILQKITGDKSTSFETLKRKFYEKVEKDTDGKYVVLINEMKYVDE